MEAGDGDEVAAGTSQWVVVYANDAHRLADVELWVLPPHAMEGTAGSAVIDKLRPRRSHRQRHRKVSQIA